MTTSTPRWQGIGITDLGRVRRSNQDAFLITNEIGLFVVADGMGGHAGGDVASRLVVETFQEALRPLDAPSPTHHGETVHSEAFLRRMVATANARILDTALRDPQLHNMGTTLVASSIVDTDDGAVARIIHVGDSRAYVFRRGQLRQVTRDHSVIEDFVRRGLLSPEQAAIHPNRHALTRAVGLDANVDPDFVAEPLEPKDIVLLCTDGLTKMLEDREIAAFIARLESTPSVLCRVLIDECNRRGGSDNITLVLCTRTVPATDGAAN